VRLNIDHDHPCHQQGASAGCVSGDALPGLQQDARTRRDRAPRGLDSPTAWITGLYSLAAADPSFTRRRREPGAASDPLVVGYRTVSLRPSESRRLAALLAAREALVCVVLVLSVLLAAALPWPRPAESGLAKRPRSGLALTRRTRPRSLCSEEDEPS
jgi:hypothetical protein